MGHITINDQVADTTFEPISAYPEIGIPPSIPSLCESVFNSMRDAIVVIDTDATIAQINPATLQMTGYLREELIGQPVEILSKNKKLFSKIFARSLQNDSLARRLATSW